MPISATRMVAPVVVETRKVAHVSMAKIRWERSQAFLRVNEGNEIAVQFARLAAEEYSERRFDLSDLSLTPVSLPENFCVRLVDVSSPNDQVG